MRSKDIKNTIHALAFIQPLMVDAVLKDNKAWNSLYEAHKRFERALREEGFSWETIQHIEHLGDVIYQKREQGTLEMSMFFWLT